MTKFTYDYANIHDLDDIMYIETSDFSTAEASSREAMQEKIERTSDTFLVARDENGKVVGFVAGPVTAQRFLSDDIFEHVSTNPSFYGYQKITSLAVHHDYQGQGIASGLLSALTEIAKRQNRRGISLTCHDYLIPYYERFGFVNEGLSESQLGGETWYDMVLDFKKA